MEYLYVCLFSNGHIKVGRSFDPVTRIKQHEDRVSCMGVTVARSEIAQCKSSVMAAESVLIERCAKAATARHKNEWFVGLRFDEVYQWAQECAATDFPEPAAIADGARDFRGILLRLKAEGRTQAEIAAHCGCGQSVISDLANGRNTDPRFSIADGLCSLSGGQNEPARRPQPKAV